MRDCGAYDEKPGVYYMHEDQVPIFVRATVTLHQTNGNPHISSGKGPPDQLWEIRVYRLEVRTLSYWWCAADLQRNHDPEGAQLNFEQVWGERVWAHQELLAQEREADKQD
jgi:hypothetical protein